jgi:hypothetical protein
VLRRGIVWLSTYYLLVLLMLLPLLTSASLDVYYDDDNSWLYLDWKGSHTLETVQADCKRVSGFVQQLGIQKVLNDNSHVTYTTREMVSWVATEYLPWASSAGVAFVAWVCSPVLYSRSDIDFMLQLGIQEPHVAIFDDLASAYAWLSSVHVPAESKP